MAELIWGDVAVSDLENIFDYIARDSHQYAKHQVVRNNSPSPDGTFLNFLIFPTEK